MRTVINPTDIPNNKPIAPNWYPLEVTDFKEEVTKGSEAKPSDGSMNAIFEFTVTDGPDEAKGRKIRRYFNEKAMGFGDSLWATLFPEVYTRGKGGALESDMFRTSVGKKLQGYVKMDGKYPTIEDYRPAK